MEMTFTSWEDNKTDEAFIVLLSTVFSFVFICITSRVLYRIKPRIIPECIIRIHSLLKGHVESGEGARAMVRSSKGQ